MTHEADFLLEHAPWLRRLAWSLARDRDDAEDLEQEVWTAALEGGPDDPQSARRWFRSVGQRLNALHHRREGRRRAREHRAARPDLEEATPAAIAARGELFHRLMHTVEQLPDPMREAVHLRYFEGLPPKEIAQRLHLPTATVKTRLRRALERLRAGLDSSYGERAAWAPLALWGMPQVPVGGAATTPSITTTKQATGLWITAMTTKTILTSLTAVAALALGAWWLTGTGDSAREPQVADAPLRTDPSAPGEGPAAGTAPPQSDAPATGRRSAVQRQEPQRPPTPPAGFGMVVDHEGQPIPGVAIRVSRFHNMDVDRWPAEATLESDAGGLFPLPEPPQTAFLPVHPGYIPADPRPGRSPDGPTILKLLPLLEVPLEVTVIDSATGEPIPRFELTARSAFERTGRDGEVETRFHAAPDGLDCRDGRYTGTARLVLGGAHRVMVRCAGIDPGTVLADEQRQVFLQEVRAAASRDVQPVPGVTIRLEFQLDPGWVERHAPHGLVTGNVVAQQDRQPLAGVEVGIFPVGQSRPARTVQTDARGRFRIAALDPGLPAVLRFAHPELEPVRVDITAYDVGGDPVGPIEMQRRGSLRVTVLDDAGRPRPLSAYQAIRVDGESDTFRYRAHTDGMGRLELPRLPGGTYLVMVLESVSANDDDGGLARGSFQVQPGQPTEGVIQLQVQDALQVTGRILDASGTVLEDRMAMFLPEVPGSPPVVAPMQQGRFVAEGLQPGSFTVFIAPKDDGDRVTNVVILPGIEIQQDRALDLVLPTGSIRGRLQGHGDPTELRVVAVREAPEGSMAHSLANNRGPLERLVKTPAADGTFLLPEIADGEWIVKVYGGLGREARQRGESLRVIASRQVTVRGQTELGDWRIAER